MGEGIVYKKSKLILFFCGKTRREKFMLKELGSDHGESSIIRVPNEWVPQMDQPRKKAIAPIDVISFRVAGAKAGGAEAEVVV